MKIAIEDLEQVYEQLAQSMNSVSPERRELFLIKLAILSMYEIKDSQLFVQLINKAKSLEN